MADFSLAQMGLKRLASTLPDFPGATIAEQLVAGRAQAEVAIRKYVPNLKFDVGGAEAAMHEIDTWADRNQAHLQEALDPVKHPGNDLPQQLRTELGANKAQEFIVATFTIAAVGLGPWNAGEVARVSAGSGTFVEGVLVNESWARSDAAMRLDTFRTIVALEKRGDLQIIFQPSAAVAGLGAVPWLAVAIVTAIIAAAVVVFLVFDRNLQRNNQLMRDLCMQAKAEGRDDVVKECIRATAELQESMFGAGWGKTVAKGVLVVGGAYLAVKYLLPRLMERRGTT